MAPPVEAFHASQLANHIQYLPNGHKRKKPIDLEKCALRELIQFNCDVVGPVKDPKSIARCEPVLRLFRKCANGLMVDVTSYDGIYDK